MVQGPPRCHIDICRSGKLGSGQRLFKLIVNLHLSLILISQFVTSIGSAAIQADAFDISLARPAETYPAADRPGAALQKLLSIQRAI
jgi:hypothetical protein